MKRIDINDRKPKNNQYVLVHLTKDNWGDEDDPKGNRYYKVVKFVKGISEKEREAMLKCTRKMTYSFGDETSNNERPYGWTEFGPGKYFGQEVDFWFELPD